MIFAESISREVFLKNLEFFRASMPERAWGLATPAAWPVREYLYFPSLDLYAACRMHNNAYGRIANIECVFRFGSGSGGATEAVLDYAKTCGAAIVRLDCFEGVHKAWQRAGFETNYVVEFMEAQAPTMWRPEYGTPPVYYMEKDMRCQD